MSKKSTEFHIKSNDYFGTLATILSLFCQNYENDKSKKENIDVLNSIIIDLLELQKSYKIIKK